MSKNQPRSRPCPSCPYRQDVPSGIWDASEYDKLTTYDGATAEQAMAGAFRPFFCHTEPEYLCGGWVGTHNMAENLAIRVNHQGLNIDAILNYHTDVPLFGSGAEAAKHGRRDIDNPGPAAVRYIEKLINRRRGR